MCLTLSLAQGPQKRYMSWFLSSRDLEYYRGDKTSAPKNKECEVTFALLDEWLRYSVLYEFESVNL